MAKVIEELRSNEKVMSNLWLPAQMRQPGRPMYTDLTKSAFGNLLYKKNFELNKDVDGDLLLVPQWKHCLSYA